MNFMEAVKAMKEGNKVRRKSWFEKNYFICWSMDRIYGFMNDKREDDRNFELHDFEATDWEIYEEDNWNLVDKREYMVKGSSAGKGIWFEEDIKTFIQKLKIDMANDNEINIDYHPINKIIDKRAGDL